MPSHDPRTEVQPPGGPRAASGEGTLPNGQAEDPHATRVPDDTEEKASRMGKQPSELPHIPGYDVMEELGRGGMGVVYKARDLGLNRLVAIKMILAGAYAGQSQIRRFKTEAEAVAQLQHPNIVQIYEISQWRSESMGPPVPFFSLEYVDGGTLDRHLRGNPLAPLEAAQLVETLARAMQAAHDHGIVHRDLKPANVLLATPRGPGSSFRLKPNTAAAVTAEHIPLTAIPKISDFGLAKQVQTDSGTTRTGEVIGTPSYMAPEQAIGNTKAIGPAADVYALGAILYESLTGRPPFKAPTAVATITQLLTEDPVPVTQLQVGTPRDLDTICLKCLAKEPKQRYASAQELADDLSRFQRGDPIRARPPTVSYLARKFLQRHRTSLLMAAAVLLLLLLGAALAFVWIDAERNIAVAALTREEEAHGEVRTLLGQAQQTNQQLSRQQRELQSLLAANYMQAGINDCVNYQPGLGLSTLLAAYETAPPDDPLRASARLLMAGWEPALFPRLMHGDAIEAVAFHPTEPFVITASRDQKVQFWDSRTWRRLGEPITAKGKIWTALFSPDGRFLATGDDEKGVVLWNVASRQPIGPSLDHPQPRMLAFSPDGRFLASGGMDGLVRIWEVSSLKQHGPPLQHEKPVWAVAFSPDGQTLAAGGEDRLLRFWNPLTGAAKDEPLPHRDTICTVAYRPDGQRFFTGDWSGAGRIYDAATRTVLSEAIHYDEAILGAVYTPDGKHVFVGCRDNTAQEWDAEKGIRAGPAWRHERSTRAVACSPDGLTFLTGSRDAKARVILKTKPKAVGPAFQHPGPVLALAVSADGKRLATACRDGKARLWDLATGQRIGIDMKHDGPVTALAFAGGGSLLVTGSLDRTLCQWNGLTGERAGEERPFGDEITSLAVSPDDTSVLISGKHRAARIFSLKTGQIVGETLGHDGPVTCVAWTSGTQRLLTGGEDRRVRLWDPTTSTRAGRPLDHPDEVLCLAVDRAGKLAATGNKDNKGRLWELATQRPLHELYDDRGHTRDITAIAISPDSTLVLTGGEDPSTRLWDVLTGKAVGEPLEHDSAVRSVAFLPDGSRYLVGHDSGQVEMWPTPKPYPDEPRRLAAWIRARTSWTLEGPTHRGLNIAEWDQSWEEVDKLGGPLSAAAR